jgi:hypothetical protein
MRIPGYLVILAMLAGKITPYRRDRSGTRGGKEMVKGLFLDRIDILCHHPAIHKGNQQTILIFPYLTKASSTRFDAATMMAERAGHSKIFFSVIQTGLFHGQTFLIKGINGCRTRENCV